MQVASLKGSVVHFFHHSFLVLFEVLTHFNPEPLGTGKTFQLGFPKRNLARQKGEADGVAAALDFAAAVVFCFVSPQHQWALPTQKHPVQLFCNTSIMLRKHEEMGQQKMTIRTLVSSSTLNNEVPLEPSTLNSCWRSFVTKRSAVDMSTNDQLPPSECTVTIVSSTSCFRAHIWLCSDKQLRTHGNRIAEKCKENIASIQARLIH